MCVAERQLVIKRERKRSELTTKRSDLLRSLNWLVAEIEIEALSTLSSIVPITTLSRICGSHRPPGKKEDSQKSVVYL